MGVWERNIIHSLIDEGKIKLLTDMDACGWEACGGWGGGGGGAFNLRVIESLHG